MICVSVAEPSVEGCLEALAGAELGELRLDRMALTPEGLRRLFAQPVPLIATCRPGTLSDEARGELLASAIEAGAAWVDMEVEAPPALRERIVARARSAGRKVIISFHDLEATPPREALARIVERCEAAGADLVKIACRVRAPADAARLLGLLDAPRPRVVAGLGPAGLIVRVAAPLLGAPFTYAAAREGRETAPGQPTRAELERILRLLGEAR